MSVIKKFFHKLLHGRKFFVLFILIFLWILLEPLLERMPVIYEFFLYVYFLLSLIIMYAISPHKAYFIIYSVSLITSIILFKTRQCWPGHFMDPVLFTFEFINNSIIIICILWYTSAKKTYSRDDIFAAVLAFLLIGLCFGDIYYNLYAIDGHCVNFAKSGIPLADVRPGGIVLTVTDFLYFSFMTLTTTGYGDIYPVSSIAKRLCCVESCMGVLYIAVFIGRLVAMYEAPEKTKIKKE